MDDVDSTPVGLAEFLDVHKERILARWDELASGLPDVQSLSRPVLRNEMHLVLERIAELLAAKPSWVGEERAEVSVTPHILQRVEVGVPLAAVVVELFSLREAIEALWTPARREEGRAAIDALRRAVDAVMLASVEHFARVRMTHLDVVDSIVRAYPGRTFAETMRGVLGALVSSLAGVDAVALLLREDGEQLRLRAWVGFQANEEEEPPVAFGEGIAGLIAAERTPRLVRSASDDPLIQSPALRAARLRGLYGIPLLRGEALLGVAHVGSRSAADFSDEVKTLFRITMDRLVGLLSQESLRERLDLEHAQTQAIVDNSPTVIFSKDLDGRYLAINRRALSDLGMTPEQFLGRTDEEIFPPDLGAALRRTDLEVLARRTTIEVEEVVASRARGHRTYLSVKFPLPGPEGRVIGVGGVATDITERRRFEKGQSLLVEIGGMLSAALDAEQALSRAARRVLDDLADCCIIDLQLSEGVVRRVAVEHREAEKREVARGLLTTSLDRRRPHLVETVLRSRELIWMRDISPRYLDTIAQSPEHRELLRALDPRSMIQVPLLARGRLLGAWVFLRGAASSPFDEHDVRLARELGSLASLLLDNSRLYRGALLATRAREQLLGVVAHELRNPLGSMLLSARRLSDLLPEETLEERRTLEGITRAATRMSKLVNDLLDQHAAETGHLTLVRRRIPAPDLVRDAANLERARVEAAGRGLDVEIAEGLPDVEADRERIQQVFANLVDNALKFAPGTGRIALGASREGGEVRFYVRDSGPGIAPELLVRVFERHWVGEISRSRGVGLGLWISKGIVEAHGGRIWATSVAGAGTTVHFTLPPARSA